MGQKLFLHMVLLNYSVMYVLIIYSNRTLFKKNYYICITYFFILNRSDELSLILKESPEFLSLELKNAPS